jgi:hypothetical protein
MIIDIVIKVFLPDGRRLSKEVHRVKFLAPFFLFCIYDLPNITTKIANLVLYVETSKIVSDPSPQDFVVNMNKVFVDINEWFGTNLLQGGSNMTGTICV